MALVPCYLSHIVLEEHSNDQAIFVAEREGERRVRILIGANEALAIDRGVKGFKPPRPLTHDLLVDVLDKTRWRCKEVRIVDLRDKGGGPTFFAELVLTGPDNQEVALDCRPSDAIAVLVRSPEVPLLVEEAVLEEAGG